MAQAGGESHTRAPDTTTTYRGVLEVYPAGSIPSPEALQQYERIVPSIGPRWLDTFLSETTHRRDREKSSDRALTRAQWFALAIMLVALAVTFAAVMQHQPVGEFLGFGSVATLGYVFLSQRQKEDRED
jgi:uncharacterized membrane protein